jgi:magnesium chelatase family protein
MMTNYQKSISDPLLDRIDIHIEVPRRDYEKLSGSRVSESSESIRARVQTTRNIQQVRFTNSQSTNPDLPKSHAHRGDQNFLPVAG